MLKNEAFPQAPNAVVNESDKRIRDRAFDFHTLKHPRYHSRTSAPTPISLVLITTTNKGEQPMDTLLLWVGRLAGLGGVLLCVWAIYNRMGGSFSAFGFQVGTLLQAGMTAILVGCLCLLIVLTNRPPR